MKQYLRIFSMLLLMLIGIGGGDVFGAETTKTISFTNGLPSDWTKTGSGTITKQSDYQSKSCLQLQKGAEIISPQLGKAYSKFSMSIARSSKGTTFTISYKTKSNPTATVIKKINTSILTSSGKWTDYEVVLPVEAQTESCQLIFSTATNSYYIYEIVLTEVPTGVPTLSFSNLETKVYFGQEETFTAPTLTLKDAGGNVVSDETFTYTSSNETAFSVDNSGKVTFNAKNATATTTITATYAGTTEAYKGLTASYTLTYKKDPSLAYTSIKELKDNATDGEEVTLNLTNAKVLCAKGDNVFIRDNEGAICFYKIGLTFATNDDVYGTIKGQYKIYKGLPEFAKTTNTNATGLTITAGTPATPKDLTTGDFKDYDCDLVSIKKGTAGNDGTNTIVMNSSTNFAQFYDKFSTFASPYEDAIVDVTGIVIPYQASATDPITYEICPLSKYDIIYHFDEAASNAVGAAADVKVQLTRTLSQEYWNTFCVPFSMTAEQIAATFGEGTKVTEYASTDGTTLNFNEATAITAGVPYLIKPAVTTANPAIEGVTIAAGDAQEEGSTYKFIGIYSPKALATNGTELFIGTDSQLYSPAEGKNTINGMRAYLKVPAGTEGARLNILGEMVTAIDGVSLNGNDEVKVMNLKGQWVGNTTKGLAKGIYVVNGKKMVINK